MILDGMPIEAHGEGVAYAIARRLLADLGADVRESPAAPAAGHIDGIAVSPFGALVSPRPQAVSHHAVHAVGGALMAQWSYRPGPVLLTTPYCDVALGAALPLLALARRLGLWRGEQASALEALFVLQSGAYSYGPAPAPGRWAEQPRGQYPTYSLYPCRDGWIFLGALSPGLALKAFTALDLADQLDARLIEGMFDKESPARTAIRELLTGRLAAAPARVVLERLRNAGVPCSPVPPFADACETPLARQLAVSPLVTVALRPETAPLARPSGRRLRVLEVAGYISGPFIGRLLCDLGADVIKLEPLDGDPLRRQGLSFAAWNHGKRTAAVDLRSEAGQALFATLASEADIVVTNYLPGALAHLGLEAPRIFALNPRAILVDVFGYPEASGREREAAFDPAIQAAFGLMRLQGGDDEPVKPQIAASDYVAAMLAVSGVLAVLHRRQQLGELRGARIVTSLAAAGSLLAYGASTQPGGAMAGGRDFAGRPGGPMLHECRDGWLLVERAGGGDAGGDFAAVCAGLDLDAAMAAAAARGFAAAPCLHPDALPGVLRPAAGSLFHEVRDEAGSPVLTPRLFGMEPRDARTPPLAPPSTALSWA